MAKKKPQLIGFEDIASEESASNILDEIPSSEEQGDDDNMTKGKGQTAHNLIEMEEEVTVTAEGIADLFNTVEDKGEDQEMLEMLAEAEGEKPKALEADKPVASVKVTVDDARSYMLTLLDQAFPNFVQEFHDRRIKGEDMSTKDVKKIIVERAIEAALADPKQADIIKNFGGKKEWRKFLKAQLETETNKKRFKEMVKELKKYSDEELETFLELQEKSKPEEPKVEDASATDESGSKVEVEVSEPEIFLVTELDKKNKKPEKPKAEEPKKTVVPPVTTDDTITGAAQMIELPDIVLQRFNTAALYGYKAV